MFLGVPALSLDTCAQEVVGTSLWETYRIILCSQLFELVLHFCNMVNQDMYIQCELIQCGSINRQCGIRMSVEYGMTRINTKVL